MSEKQRLDGELIETALSEPVPNLSIARSKKEYYRDYPIDNDTGLYNEKLVSVGDYGLAGQNYYSRLNVATGQAIIDIPKELFLRKSLAEKLADLNQRLNGKTVVDFFGGPVELYIEDAYRPYSLQKHLYEKVFPELIRQQNPAISDENLEARLNELIALPSNDAQHPSPHSTGGAVDIVLRYKQDTPDYVKGAEVPVGHVDGDTSKRVYPDYFELLKPQSDHDKLAQRNRRAFYAVMTGKAYGIDTGLQVNPTEWWHWSWGDQMWAKLRDEPSAFYGQVDY